MPFHSKHFHLEELAEGVFAAIHREGGGAIGNAGLVDLGDSVLVFDTFISPVAAEDLRRAAEEVIAKPVLQVINSHYHNDHIRGNQVFADTEIIASAETIRLIDTKGREELAGNRENAAKLHSQYSKELESSEDEEERKMLVFAQNYYWVINEGLQAFEWTPPTRSYAGSLKLEGPRRKVELRSYAGGHTGDDAILLLAEDGIAFLSDLLFIDNHPYLADGNPEKWMAHLKALEALDEAVLLPGHGPLGTRRDLEILHDYIGAIVEQVDNAHAKGQSLEALLEEMMPARYAGWELSIFYASNVKFLYAGLEDPKK